MLDSGLLFGRERRVEVGEPLRGAGELGFTECFRRKLKLLDGFSGWGLREAFAVALGFELHDGLGGLGLAAALNLVFLRDLLEVVDVVDEAAFEVVDGGVYVARDGDVDEKDRTVPAAMDERAAVVGREDLPGAGGGDDDVGAMRSAREAARRG